MIGVFCEKHRREMESRLTSVLQTGIIKGGRLKTEKLKSVSTECLRSCVTKETNIERPLSLKNSLSLNGGENS
jgi:hypothetical protein